MKVCHAGIFQSQHRERFDMGLESLFFSTLCRTASLAY